MTRSTIPDTAWAAAEAVYPDAGPKASQAVLKALGHEMNTSAIAKHMERRGIRLENLEGHWTEEEIETLRLNAPRYSSRLLKERFFPDRTAVAIRNMASREGIRINAANHEQGGRTEPMLRLGPWDDECRVVFLGDQQCPEVDWSAHRVVCSFLGNFIRNHRGSKVVVLMGDGLNATTLGRFDYEIDTPGMDVEIEDYKRVIRDYREAVGDGVEFVVIEGNHEYRLAKTIQRDPRLSTLIAPWWELLDLDGILGKGSWHWVPYMAGFVEFPGPFLVHHGYRVSSHSAYAAKLHVENTGVSMIHGHCFDEETEILTPDGWKRHGELAKGVAVMTLNRGTGFLEWNEIQEVFRYSHFRELVSIKGRDIDLRVTDGHGLWVGTDSGNHHLRWEETTAGARFGHKRTTFQLAGHHQENPDLAVPDCIIELAAWIMAEGSFDPYGGVRIAQSDAPDGRLALLERALAECGAIYSKRLRYRAGETEHGQHRNFDAYRYNVAKKWNRELLGQIEEFIDRTKTPTRKLAQMSLRQAMVFLDTYITADGSVNSSARNSYQIASNRKDHIDFLQELAVRTGHRTSVCCSRSSSVSYLTLNESDTTVVNEKAWGREPYDGIAWCVSVPNGTLLVRRGGHTTITLNTHRLGSFYKTFYDRTIRGYENGSLCIPQSYLGGVGNWQLGFSYGRWWGDKYAIGQAEIINGETNIEGVWYGRDA